jgi:hypothetical protein
MSPAALTAWNVVPERARTALLHPDEALRGTGSDVVVVGGVVVGDAADAADAEGADETGAISEAARQPAASPKSAKRRKERACPTRSVDIAPFPHG